ncbi:MAG TPA: tetratricopeptide repeat protein [Bacteroidota bacterium]|nr:tetratricopeptide repeat protein [Bacteroidota bacterium]
MSLPPKIVFRLGLLAVLVLTVALFFPAFHFEFTNWDDDIHVTNNPDVQHLSGSSVVEIFKPTARYMYHPLTILSFAIDWSVGGGDSAQFHATNILLHILNIVLLALLLQRLGIRSLTILFCVAIFAIHPLQVESVAWISGRKELLYSFFFFSSIILFVLWRERRLPALYAGSLILFLLSLLSKPTAVDLPFVLLLLIWWKDGRIGRRVLKEISPFATASTVFTLFTVATEVKHAVSPVVQYSLLDRGLFVIYQILFYPIKLLLPGSLSACYGYPSLSTGSLPALFYLSPLAVAAIVFIVLRWKEARGIVGGGLLFYLLTLAPILQIIPFNNASLVADRYAYIPIIGLAFSIAEGGELLLEKLQFSLKTAGRGAAATFTLLVLIYAAVSFARVPVWRNSITLFDDVLAKNDFLGNAYGNRAVAKMQAGDFRGALIDADRLVALKPEEGKAYYDRGNAYLGLAEFKPAVADFSRALDLGFVRASVCYNRGTAFYRLGITDSALSDFYESRSLDPLSADAPYSIGYALFHARGDAQAATRYFDTAVALRPNYPDARYQRALAEYSTQRFGAAMEDLAAAVEALPALRNDPIVDRINRSVDSIDAKIAELRGRTGNGRGSAADLQALVGMYQILGDSLRSTTTLELLHTQQRSAEGR